MMLSVGDTWFRPSERTYARIYDLSCGFISYDVFKGATPSGKLTGYLGSYRIRDEPHNRVLLEMNWKEITRDTLEWE